MLTRRIFLIGTATAFTAPIPSRIEAVRGNFSEETTPLCR